LIQDHDLFIDLMDHLRGQARIAVDTESNSLYAYQEQVCLIQFSTEEQDYLVDSLALEDLRPLAPVFADPAIEKIFHGAEYDVKTLKRDFGYRFANLFDTRVACRTLGYQRTGLRDLVAESFQVKIDKRFQRANWGKRPLSAEMQAYARLDTHYLLPLRDRLHAELRASGRLVEAREACELITLTDPHDNGFDPDGFWHLRNTRDLSRRQMAILRELYLLRDRHARRLNRPPFKVMENRTLLGIAREAPDRLDTLKDLPGMTKGQVRRYGNDILKAVSRGRKAPYPKPPSSPSFDEAIHRRFDTLRGWRKTVANRRKVESDIILPKETLWEIARLAPQDESTLRQIMAPMEWRFQTYGQEILNLLND
jgi:ribonuclease D